MALRNLNQTLAHGRICDTGQSGVLGVLIPRTGTNGPSYIADSLTADDDAVEITGYIDIYPTLGTMVVGRFGEFTYEGASDVFTWTLRKRGISYGSIESSITMADASGDSAIVETLSFTILESATLAAVASATEAVTSAESSASTKATADSVTEAATATEAVTTTSSAVVAVAEVVTSTETSSNTLAAVSAITEAATASEASSSGTGTFASITEAATASDSENATVTFGASVTEAATATEASSNIAAMVASATEAATASDLQSFPANATTWNPSDKSRSVTLSGGNLTATSAASSTRGVRCSDPQTTGLFYFEARLAVQTAGDTGVGISDDRGNFPTLGSSALHGAIVYRSGNIWYNGNNTTKTLGTVLSTDVICVALDIPNAKIWFRKNAGNWNGSGTDNPATNTGGVALTIASTSTIGGTNIALPLYATCQMAASGDQVVANFGDTAFAQSVPSGFSAWTRTTLAPSTLFPNDSSQVTVSGNTATVSATSFSGAGSDAHYYRSAGKFSAEYTIGTCASTSNYGVGFIGAAVSYFNFGTDALGSIGYFANGTVRINNVVQLTLSTYTTGDVITVAMDLDNDRVWFRKNGGIWNGNASYDPATNTGGIDISAIPTPLRPAWAEKGLPALGDSVTMNAGDTPFVYAKPSGFYAWPVDVSAVVESATATETSTGSITIAAAITEAATATEASDALGATVTADVTEAVTSSDTQSAIAAMVATASESATASDSANGARTLINSDAESATASEAANATTSFAVARTEAGTATEAQSTTVAFVSAITETTTASEAVSGVAARVDSRTEAATASESQDASISNASGVVESVTASEASSSTVTFSVTQVEAATATEASASSLAVPHTESTTATDTSSGVVSYAASVTETVTALDVTNSIGTVNASQSESATLSDSQSASATASMELMESATAFVECDCSVVYAAECVESVTAVDDYISSLLVSADIEEIADATVVFGLVTAADITEACVAIDCTDAPDMHVILKALKFPNTVHEALVFAKVITPLTGGDDFANILTQTHKF